MRPLRSQWYCWEGLWSEAVILSCSWSAAHYWLEWPEELEDKCANVIKPSTNVFHIEQHEYYRFSKPLGPSCFKANCKTTYI